MNRFASAPQPTTKQKTVSKKALNFKEIDCSPGISMVKPIKCDNNSQQ